MKWLLTILALLYVFNPFDLLPDIVVGGRMAGRSGRSGFAGLLFLPHRFPWDAFRRSYRA